MRTSANVFTRNVRINFVRIEMGVRCRALSYNTALLVLSDLTHPLFDGHLSALPHEFAYGYYTGHPHAAHQHHEYTADVGQAKLVRHRTAL